MFFINFHKWCSVQKQLPVVHSSTTSIDERREMFERIEQLEKKLWLEQER